MRAVIAGTINAKGCTARVLARVPGWVNPSLNGDDFTVSGAARIINAMYNIAKPISAMNTVARTINAMNSTAKGFSSGAVMAVNAVNIIARVINAVNTTATAINDMNGIAKAINAMIVNLAEPAGIRRSNKRSLRGC